MRQIAGRRAKWGVTVGFERSKWIPCLYSGVEGQVWMFLHGDDFIMGMKRCEVGRLKSIRKEVYGAGGGLWP